MCAGNAKSYRNGVIALSQKLICGCGVNVRMSHGVCEPDLKPLGLAVQVEDPANPTKSASSELVAMRRTAGMGGAFLLVMQSP